MVADVAGTKQCRRSSFIGGGGGGGHYNCEQRRSQMCKTAYPM